MTPATTTPTALTRPRGDGLADLLDRILDKGLVVAGDISVSLLDIELLTIRVRLLIASADKARELGIDWWRRDPHFTGQAQNGRAGNALEQENRLLRERLERLEARLDDVLERALPAPRGGKRADSWTARRTK